MTTNELGSTVQAMLAGDKGLLAMDESIPNCHKRFAALGIPQTEEMRRAYSRQTTNISTKDCWKFSNITQLIQQTFSAMLIPRQRRSRSPEII